MARTYNELDAAVRKNSQLLTNIGVAIVAINMALNNKQDTIVYQVEDIKNIPQDICRILKVGDIVNKGNHSYRVTFRKDTEGMCLTYVDASRIETQSYDLIDTVWTYNSEDLTKFEDFSSVEVITPAGTEPVAQGLKINGVDYKIGGEEVHLYQHNIYIYDRNNQETSKKYASTIIMSSSPTKFNTISDLQTYLSEKGCNSQDKSVIMSGNYYNSALSPALNGTLISCYVDQYGLCVNYVKSDGTKDYSYFGSGTTATLTDTVIQIF